MVDSRVYAWHAIERSSSPPPSYPFLGHDGVIIQGAMHLLAALPKCGKTTLLLHTIKHWHETLGSSCPWVLWLTEEPQPLWEDRKRRMDIDHLPITFYDSLGVPPSELLSVACSLGDVVIVDTITNLMGISNMNDAASVTASMSSWISALRREKRTVWFAHHLRKFDGDGFGTAVAGSHAFVGSADVVLEVRASRKQPNRRDITVVSRYQTPESLSYEYVLGDIRSLGSSSDSDVTSYKVAPWDRAVGYA